jgi:hypothetical protein
LHEVYAEASVEPLARIERAAVNCLGIRGRAADFNGIVEIYRGLAMWFARRSSAQMTDPNTLDRGVGVGAYACQTLSTRTNGRDRPRPGTKLYRAAHLPLAYTLPHQGPRIHVPILKLSFHLPAFPRRLPHHSEPGRRG